MDIKKKNYQVKQIKTGCLSQFTYYIESKGEAIIIDPLRDVQPYLLLLKTQKSVLKYIIETHFHADFVSGHYPLHDLTKAEIIFGENDSAEFEHKQVKNNEELILGDIKLRFLHTPGHTLESICIVIIDGEKEEVVFTGDTLFIGDVGRPDLAVKTDEKIDKEYLAKKLFESLKKLKKLDNDCVVFPAHGAGSSCGKNISNNSSSTIGEEKNNNYAMLIEDEAIFVEKVTENIPPPPKYFFKAVELNKKNNQLKRSEDIVKNMKGLETEEFIKLSKSGKFQILDTRTTADYSKSHFPGSINSPLCARFAIFSIFILDPQMPILMISNDGNEIEAGIRLLRTGLNNIYGFLKGGFQNYEKNFSNQKDHFENVISITPDDLVQKLNTNNLKGKLLDIRNCSEIRNGGKIAKAIVLNFDIINDNAEKVLNKSIDYYVSCGGGLRSVMAWGALKNKGFNVFNVEKGFMGLKDAGIDIIFE